MRLICRLLAMTIVPLCFRVASSQVTKPVVNMSLEQKSITLNEPVYLVLSIENGTPEGLHVDLGANRESNYEITVTDPKGKITGPIREQVEGLSRVGKVGVSPSKTFQSSLLLSRLYNFQQPGSYGIDARLDSPIESDSGAILMPSFSSHLTLTILERNPEQLKKRAGILGDQALQAFAYSDRLSATIALEYMDDPIAIPYLEKIVRDGQQVQIEAARGLARIATLPAIDALLASATASSNTDYKIQLRSVLQNLVARVDDPQLKARIERTLQQL